MIDIRAIQGNIKLTFTPNSGSLIKRELMGDHYLLLKYNLSAPIDFEVGDYVIYSNTQGESRYELTQKTFPRYNTSTGGYEYELKFEAYYLKWGNKILFYDRQFAGGEATWHLTRTPDAHLSVVCSNLAKLGYDYNGRAITFRIDESVDMSAKLVSYDGTNIIDALTLIAETWDAEWWVEDNIIHLGRCEYNTAVDLELAGNVQNMTRSESQDEHATRIYAFGSERNLPANYRESTGVVEAVVTKRLMLPQGTDYVDAAVNMASEQAVETVVVFDDVYPRRTGTLSDVTTKEYTDTIEHADGSTTPEKWNAYRFKDPGLTFSKDYVLPAEELRLVFTSGKLNGMDFALAFNPDAKTPEEQLFEIIRNEDYGIALPNATLKPENGDTYILYGFNIALVGSQYVPAAEQELLERAQAYVEKSKIDPSVFSVEMNPVAVIQDDLNFEIGDRVNLIHRGFFKAGRESRIRGYEKHLDSSKVTYSVGNTAAYSRLKNVEGEVKEIIYQGNVYSAGGGSSVYVIGKRDLTTPTDRNVFSALRAAAEFVSKKHDDIAAGHIEFEQGLTALKDITIHSGLQTPRFVPGFLGEGLRFWMDEQGETHGVLDYLTIRNRMDVFQLTIDRIQHVGGAYLFSPAAASIEHVEELPDAYRCYVKDKDSDLFVTFDQAICQTFERNATRRYWRLVTGVATDFSYIDLSKTDCESGSAIPARGDEIIQLGHRSNTNRQNAILISSYGSEGAYQQLLKGVNSFSTAGKVKIQLGDDTFFEDVSRFSIRSGNGTSYRVPVDRGAWVAGTYYYYDRVSHRGSIWLCMAQPSTTLEPADGSSAWEKQVSQGADGGTGYRIEKIASSGYDTYREGQNYSAALGVMVFYNEEEITGTVDISRFRWTRVSENIPGDPTWNELHANAGASISITEADLAGDTSFILQFLDTDTNSILTTQF